MRLKIQKLLFLFLCTFCFAIFFPITASADIGPKPSIRITFKNLGDELCYGTLLSKSQSTGPSSAWDGIEKHAHHNENEDFYYETFDYATWKVFAEYQDSDGYYFLQEGWQVNETKELAWTYYPPSSFKILLYFPEQNIFVTSEIYERYAFDSYYTVDMSNLKLSDNEELLSEPLLITELMQATPSYNYSQEVFSLVARILITIILEMGIAFLFGFRHKKELLLLVGVNTITQILLNILLNVINYTSGSMAFTAGYILFEFIVFIIEAIIYCTFMRKISEQPKKQAIYIIYAFVANAVSFGSGFAVAKILPGIF